MPKRGEMTHSAWWEIRQDEDEPDAPPYWYGAGAGDKEGTEFDPGQPIVMDPRHWPVGTRIDVEEPWDEAFYDRLFAGRGMDRESDGSVKPCPFCGNTRVLINPERGIVWCPKALGGCEATIDTHGGTEAEAIERWNRRA